MRLIQNVKFPVSLMLSEKPTGGNPYEMLDILTGGVVEEIGKPSFTPTGRLSIGARLGDPETGRVVFLQAFGENAKKVANELKKGDVVHAVGERRTYRGATQFRLITLLGDAPIVTNERYEGQSEHTPATEADLMLTAPAIDDEQV